MLVHGLHDSLVDLEFSYNVNIVRPAERRSRSRPKKLTGPAKEGRLATVSPRTRRTKPRSFVEWKALRRWGRLPRWEVEPAGYLLRLAREEAGLTQVEFAKRDRKSVV